MKSDDELRYLFPRKNGKLATFGCTLSVEEVDYINRMIADLKALVRDMDKALIHGNCYRWCDMPNDCDAVTTGHCPFRDRMRELGVADND